MKHIYIDLNNYSFLWKDSNKNNKSLSKIINALHWYRKAEHSTKQEDKMLNYWISIENLFNLEKDVRLDVLNESNKNKFHLIQETIASVQVFKFIYEFGWELHGHYESVVSNSMFHSTINIPEDLVTKAQLRPKVGDKIHLSNFIKCLDDIKACEKNILILDKIDRVKDFYNHSSIAKKIIEEQIREIRNDVLMIYRFRNLIVHNAHFDSTLLPYFVWKIRSFSRNLIQSIIGDFSDKTELSDLIIKFHLKREKFLFDFENGSVNLFKDKG